MRKNKPHKDYKKWLKLREGIEDTQVLADRHGIFDIFQDNNSKLLETILILNLRVISGRSGNDAIDCEGNEYELKSINMNLTYNVSTNHHLNHNTIEKYRKVVWVFSIYEGINLIAIYKLQPNSLENLFEKWEAKCFDEQKDLNNPKIPLSLVIDKGELMHGEVPFLKPRPSKKTVKTTTELSDDVVYNRKPTTEEKTFKKLFE